MLNYHFTENELLRQKNSGWVLKLRENLNTYYLPIKYIFNIANVKTYRIVWIRSTIYLRS